MGETALLSIELHCDTVEAAQDRARHVPTPLFVGRSTWGFGHAHLRPAGSRLGAGPSSPMRQAALNKSGPISPRSKGATVIHIASAGTKCCNLRRPLRFDTGAVLAASEIK